MRQTNVRGTLSLRGFRKLRTGAIVATGVILLGLGFLAPTVSASEQDGVWVARTVAEVKADIQKEGDLFKYVIKWGDTLSVISEASNIPVDVLQEMNQTSGKNLFLPHNELYFTEAETVSDTVTKHKIVIKESGASGEVRTYEVLLKKDQETKAVTFELTDVTEKVEKMTVNYSPVYQPVSAPIVESAEESAEELAPVAPAVTSPEVKEETEAPVVPKAEESAASAPKSEELVAPAPKAEEPSTPAPKAEEPAATEPTSEEPTTPAPKVEEPTTPAPKVEEPATPAPKVEEPATSALKAEEPAATTPKSEEPAVTTPKAEEPATTTPKSEEPTTPAPKVEEPVAPAPKVEEPSSSVPKSEEPTTPAPKSEEPATPAPKAEEPTTPAPKSEEPAAPTSKVEDSEAPAPKDDESASSVESPSTGNHSDESGTPSETPTGDSTSLPVTSGETNPTEQPAGETGKSETTSESSNTPSAEATNDSGTAATSTPTPEASTSEPKSEEELKKEEALKSAKKESVDDNIGEVVKIKADAIEKVTDADEKARLKEALKALQDKAIEEINKAKDDEEVATVTEKYQNEINALDVPGEEVSSPNYGREGLTNNGPGGTTIDNGSTAIGHGASGTSRSAVASPTQPSSTSERGSSFRNAPSVQARARRVARSTSEPDGTVNISYNFAGMPDIHGFLSDPGENNTVTIPAGTSEAQAKELVKEKIQAKIKDLAARGYHVKNDIIFEQDTTVKNYNYVVTFTKEATGTSGFRMAPAVQPRASRNRRSLEQPAPQKVKVNVFYNFDQMKDIAGFLGDINGTSLEIAEGLSNEQVKAAVKNQVDAKKEELRKRGYTVKEDYLYKNNGKDYNYVVTFTKEKTGTTGFRIAPEVQVRAKKVVKRDLSNKTKQINIYYNLKALKDIAGALGELGGENMLTVSGDVSKEDLKRAIEEKTKAQIEKLKKQGFTVTSKTDLDQIVEGGDNYDYVIEFTKEAKTQPVGTTGFRMAPAVQPRASRNRRSLEQPAPQKVKVNVFYNFDQMKDIAGFLGDINGTSLEIAEGLSNEEVKVAVKKQVEAKKEELSKRGYTFKEDYVYQSNGKDYNYVVTFSKTAK